MVRVRPLVDRQSPATILPSRSLRRIVLVLKSGHRVEFAVPTFECPDGLKAVPLRESDKPIADEVWSESRNGEEFLQAILAVGLWLAATLD